MPTLEISGVPHTYDWVTSTSSRKEPCLVFIHGWLLSRSYWQPIAQDLSNYYPCLLYDLRGFGDSQPLENSASGSYDLTSYVDDLRILMQALEIEQAWLIGHSLGGSIALKAAQLVPELVQGVVCLNSGGGIYLKEEFERFRSAGQQIVKNRPQWLSHIPGLDLVFSRIMVHQTLNRCWGKERLKDFLRADQEAALGTLLETTTEPEVHLLPQVVANLQQPVYFIAGAEDQVMEPKYVQHLASFHQLFHSQTSNVFEIPNCGHFAMLEQTEWVGNKIRFLLEEGKTP